MEVKKYIVRSNSRALLALFRDWAAIVTLIWLNVTFPSIYLYLISVWIIGAFQFALGESIMHEAVHHNLFTHKKWHYRLQFLFAYPFFRTVWQFRVEHIFHHNRLGKENDHLVSDYRKFGLYKGNANYFFIFLIKPILGFAGYYYCSGITLKPFRKEGWKIIAFWLIIFTVFFFCGKLLWIVKFWLVPFLWCYYSYLYWSEISDHFNTISGTRSNLNPISNFFTHNNGYHYIHHKYPTIPWFILKKAYHDLTPQGGDISKGFLQTYRQMIQNRSSAAIHQFGINETNSTETK